MLLTQKNHGVEEDDLMVPYSASVQRLQIPGGHEQQMKETLRQIGSAIRKASVYPPIRNHAAALATLAQPKDFLGQLKNIYRDFIGRWRYVKDPTSRELLTASPEAIWRLTMGGDGVGVGNGRGAGDCDCATIALGSQLEAVGFKTRLGTTASINASPGRLFGHVFIQALVPKRGWITLDPVLHPKRPFGATAHHSRFALWDLDGNMLGKGGNYLGDNEMEVNDMAMRRIDDWQDYGMAGATEPEGYEEPIEWSTLGLSDWGWMSAPGGGKVSTIATYGYIDGAELNGMMAEVDENDSWDPSTGTYRTPMLELSVDDYQYMRQNGSPYDGMLALGDTGEPYVYDGLGGFFKKIFKKIKKGVKKVAQKIKRGVKKLLKKTKFGRWLIKMGGKLKRIAMKIVKPLVKFVGKYAAKLAPIAAMIPGYGTAIAAALAAAGKVAQLMQKYGIFTDGKKGKVRSLKIKSPRKRGHKRFKGFRQQLEQEARRMKRFSRKDPKRFRQLATKLAKKAPVKSPSRAVRAATSPSKAQTMILQSMMDQFQEKYPREFASMVRRVGR